MEALIDFLRTFTSDEASLRHLVVMVVAATIFVFGLGVSIIVSAITSPVRRRLGLLNEKDRDRSRLTLKIATAVGPVAAYVLPKEELERNKVQRDLVRAGFRSPQALQVFYGVKTLLAILCPIVVMSAARFFPDLTTQSVVMYAMAGAGAGLLVPNFVLNRKVESRMRQLRNGFPDALDLLVVCVEAGLGLNQAFVRVAEEIHPLSRAMSQELHLLNLEIRAGKPRDESLRNLHERTGVDDIRTLALMLIQADRFGTSVANALRVHSDTLRDKRRQRAEEAAAKTAIKLIFPLVLCIFPAMFVVLVGPGFIQITEALRGIGG